MKRELQEYLPQIEEIRAGTDQGFSARILNAEILQVPVNGTELPAWIYRPEGAQGKQLATLFNIHGGGNIAGLPQHDDEFCEFIRQGGIQVINLSYRLAPEYRFPVNKQDVYEQIAWFVKNSARFEIDPDRLAIGGHSTGGNIAAVVCMMAKKSGEFSFRCQILDYPILDLATPLDQRPKVRGQLPAEASQIFDACYCDADQVTDPYCSPVCAGVEALRGLPPAVIVTAEFDHLAFEGMKYAKMLSDAGVEVEAKRFPGVCHGFTIGAYGNFNPNPEAAEIGVNPQSKQEALDMMLNGLRKYCLGAA